MIHLLQQFWPLVSGLAILLVTVFAAGHAVIYKRDSRAAVAWVGLILLSPFFGALLYFLLGINRIRRKASVLKEAAPAEAASEKARQDVRRIQVPHFGGLCRFGDRVTGLPLTEGNKIVPLFNGDEAFPAMLEGIRSAKKSIVCSTYIFGNDPVGERFVDEFAAAVRRGVEVRVLIDDVGARYSIPSILGPLRRAGVPVARFLPTFFPGKAGFINLRNHRKLLCIDGRKAFIGGINIRAGHWISRNPPHPVKDLHFSVDGPVVAHLREVFASDWEFTSGEKLDGEAWQPSIAPAGEACARGVADGPDEDFDKIRWILIGALAAAKESVKVVTPYFLPDTALSTTLNAAALRGVDVDIFLPEKGNLPFVDWATQAILWQNVKEGCRVWKAPGTFDHSKVMIVDDSWVFFGSSNWDPRSLRLNFELNVEAFSRPLATQMNTFIEEKKGQSRRVLLDELDGRSLPVKLRDGVSRLLSPYL
ncbi:MAG: phospholipase D-like domain-containing protein [Opitutales bacterium]